MPVEALQSRFAGDAFAPIAKVTTTLVPLSREGLNKIIDIKHSREIPNLRIVDEGEQILITTRSGYFTRVTILAGDCILTAKPLQGHKNKLKYFLRNTPLLESVRYKSAWEGKMGQEVLPIGGARKISTEKEKSEVLTSLRYF